MTAPSYSHSSYSDGVAACLVSYRHYWRGLIAFRVASPQPLDPSVVRGHVTVLVPAGQRRLWTKDRQPGRMG